MAYTLNENGQPWEYMALLNQCINILVTTSLGAVLAYFRVFDAKTFVPNAVKFVFHVALPLHIVRGIGIVVDFYNPMFQWNYIVAFLALRVVGLAMSFGMVIVSALWKGDKRGIGDVVVLWLTLTWISTVILGVPILQAMFKSEPLALFYGLLAAVSSFIFQLPFQLLFLECHQLEQQCLEERARSLANDNDVESGPNVSNDVLGMPTLSEKDEKSVESPPTSDHNSDLDDNPAGSGENQETDLCDVKLSDHGQEMTSDTDCAPATLETGNDVVPLFLWAQFARRKDVWTKISLQLLRNPIIWGIVFGFFLSLSTIGPRFLNPFSEEYVPGLGWFFEMCGWFGAIVSPLSLFAMGVWMQSQGKKMFRIPISSAILCMVSKLVIVPLIMVGLARGFSLTDQASRAAVLIAALPISMASFTLASHYKIGEAILSENVALGTALMLPTIIIWNVVMDAIGIFPYQT